MAEKKTLAIFDFDGTMIRGDSIVSFVWLGVRLKKLSLWEYVRLGVLALPYALGLLSDEVYKTRALRFYGEMSAAEKQAVDQVFVEETLLPKVRPQALQCLADRKKEGCLCLLVSASTENYMRMAAERLGFDALLCTRLDENGQACANCKGAEKERRIREYLKESGTDADFGASFAYGDSRSDLPVLSLCGHPVQVNPKRALRAAAPEMERVFWK